MRLRMIVRRVLSFVVVSVRITLSFVLVRMRRCVAVISVSCLLWIRVRSVVISVITWMRAVTWAISC